MGQSFLLPEYVELRFCLKEDIYKDFLKICNKTGEAESEVIEKIVESYVKGMK